MRRRCASAWRWTARPPAAACCCCRRTPSLPPARGRSCPRCTLTPLECVSLSAKHRAVHHTRQGQQDRGFDPTPHLLQGQQAALEAQLAQHKRRCLIGLLVVEAAPGVGNVPARGGTPFSCALAAAAGPADPAPATIPAPAGPTVQPAGSGAASMAAEALAQPAAAAAAPCRDAVAPDERPCVDPGAVAVSLPPPPPPLPPPSPPPSPPPPLSPQEQHEQRQRTDACGTTPEAASREPDSAVRYTAGLTAALREHGAAASLRSSPAAARAAEEEQLDSARSSRKHSSSSTRRSKRRSQKEERAASSKAARAHSPGVCSDHDSGSRTAIACAQAKMGPAREGSRAQ